MRRWILGTQMYLFVSSSPGIRGARNQVFSPGVSKGRGDTAEPHSCYAAGFVCHS